MMVCCNWVMADILSDRELELVGCGPGQTVDDRAAVIRLGCQGDITRFEELAILQ